MYASRVHALILGHRRVVGRRCPTILVDAQAIEEEGKHDKNHQIGPGDDGRFWTA